jgi:hypothetical protein
MVLYHREVLFGGTHHVTSDNWLESFAFDDQAQRGVPVHLGALFSCL